MNDLKIPVLLTGMKAFANLGPLFMGAYGRIYPDLADEYDVAFYPFFLEGVAMKAEMNQQDGLHPNAAGVKVIVDGMLPEVEKLLKK